MEDQQIKLLLITLDPDIRLVYEGPPAGCPHCARPVSPVLPEAA